MASLIPAFVQALQDRDLRGHPRDVYIWCHEHLDTQDFRPVKHSVIESALQINSVSAGRAVRRLLDRGYLQRGDRAGRLWTYRLRYSRP